ncbi:MAG: glycoside hydrolase family 43 protein [Mucilaginibacter sp.]|uniref:glycoside hydrolase family 43 protein n=1 Tax=Mucilaginibacter sp. TaxID=1882438 RepID=UPI003267CA3F
MKRTFLSIITLFIAISTYAQQKDIYLFSYFKNNGQDGLHLAYSEDGLKWQALKGDSSFLKPMVSKDKIMRDPCIIRGADGLFHMVWTDSWTDRGIGYASSKDLIHWSEQTQLMVMEKEPTAQNCWAPELTYDDVTKTYMLYWATTIPGRFAQSDTSAEGKKSNHRIYYQTTKDFKTYSETKVLYDPHFSSIDATIVKDGRQFIMFFKNETKQPAEKNLRIAVSRNLIGPYSPPTPKITGDYWAEGPTTLKIGNKWIVYFDKYTQHKYGAIESTDLKNWIDISDQLVLPKGIRHGSVFKVTQQEFDVLKNSGQ